jgi:DnaJ-class molecular chaperone
MSANTICDYCKGSGEGMADGVKCVWCQGTGRILRARLDEVEYVEETIWERKQRIAEEKADQKDN